MSLISHSSLPPYLLQVQSLVLAVRLLPTLEGVEALPNFLSISPNKRCPGYQQLPLQVGAADRKHCEVASGGGPRRSDTPPAFHPPL